MEWNVRDLSRIRAAAVTPTDPTQFDKLTF